MCLVAHVGGTEAAVKLDPPSRLPEVTNPFIRSLTPPVVPSIRIKYHARGHTEPWRVVKVPDAATF